MIEGQRVPTLLMLERIRRIKLYMDQERRMSEAVQGKDSARGPDEQLQKDEKTSSEAVHSMQAQAWEWQDWDKWEKWQKWDKWENWDSWDNWQSCEART